MPLNTPRQPRSLLRTAVAPAIPILVAIIDMLLVMMHMHNASVEATKSLLLHRKELKVGVDGDGIGTSSNAYSRHESKDETLAHPHEKQILDLVAWHIDILDAKWYVKPRSTCWFEEYLFNIYTPDMFYNILTLWRQFIETGTSRSLFCSRGLWTLNAISHQ